MSPQNAQRSTPGRELKLTEDDVRQEHLKSVNVPAHWAYMVSVLGGSTLLMIVLMAVLGGSAGG